jgi:hypothetical protein
MPPLPGNIYKSEIDLGLPFMVPDLVYKYQMICLWGTYVIGISSYNSAYFYLFLNWFKILFEEFILPKYLTDNYHFSTI